MERMQPRSSSENYYQAEEVKQYRSKFIMAYPI